MIQVIHIEYVDGAGTEDDPVTRYHRYYAPDGELLADTQVTERRVYTAGR